MFEHIEKIKGPVLALKITGEITDAEHDRLDRLIRAQVARWGRIRVFLTVMHYPAWSSAEALYEDLRMFKLHSDHIEKMAVVGDRQWKSTWVGLFGLFSGMVTAFFGMDDIEDGWRWVAAN